MFSKILSIQIKEATERLVWLIRAPSASRSINYFNMKMGYIIFALLIAAGLVIAFSFKKKNAHQTNDNPAMRNLQDTTKPGVTKLKENPYEGLKRLAYSIQYHQLGLPDPGEKEVLYGVLMDWDYDGATIITLTSFKTGDVSLYFSTGAAILGAGQHAEVSAVSKVFIQKAAALVPQANSQDTVLTSERGVLKFYLLTNKRKYTIKDKMENVYHHTSPLSVMFDEANKLIGYIRMAEEKMQQQRSNH